MRRELAEAERAAKMAMSYEKAQVWPAIIIALEQRNQATTEKLTEQLFKWPHSERGARVTQRVAAYRRGYLNLKSQSAAEAVKNFQEALRYRPLVWNIDSYEDCLANAYLELGQLDEAIAEYERILRLNPNYPLVHYHLALAYERKAQSEQARAEYQSFLEVWREADPNIPEIIAAKKQLASS